MSYIFLWSDGQESHPECWLLRCPQVPAGQPRLSPGGNRLCCKSHKMYFIYKKFKYFHWLPFCVYVSLFAGYCCEPGISRLVCFSQRNIPDTGDKSWRQNWHIHKSRRLRNVRVIACFTPENAESSFFFQTPVDVSIDMWVRSTNAREDVYYYYYY